MRDERLFSFARAQLTMLKTQAVGFLSYMSTIINLNGKRYFTYSNDHPPAHVHVSSNGNKAKFELNCCHGPVVCVKARTKGYSDTELTAIRKEVEGMLGTCCQHWKDNHGEFI